MSSKDKENKSLQDKLKQFFRINKGATGSLKGRGDFSLTEDIQKELSREAPFTVRCKALKDLSEVVLTHRLEDKAIEKLWMLLQDLLRNDQNVEARHLMLTFLQCLIKGQSERLGMLRAHFFRVVKHHDYQEDVIPRFDMLLALTDNGKDLLHFEEEMGPFLLNWLPDITRAGRTVEFLNMLVNIIKFNVAYVDEEVIMGLVHHVCMLCCSTNQTNVVLACLQVLDTVVAYTILPSESLPQFIGALCRTVNGEPYCQTSWRVMRNLLGTHMGHSALYTMCRILQEPSLKQDGGLLRGSVFFINMGLWGSQPCTNLRCPPSSILPSILHAVEANQPIVTYEVMMAIQKLVHKLGAELQDPSWDLIITILEIIAKQIESSTLTLPNISTHLHDTLSQIEYLIETGNYNGSEKQFFDIVEYCSSSRPEASVLRLVKYLSQNIVPTRHFWFSNLYNLLQRYYRQETRTKVRLEVLEILTNVVKLNRMQHEEELLDRIVIPHLVSVAADPDVAVRNAVAELLIDLCSNCESKKCLEILDILEKLLNRPFDHYNSDSPINESEITDMKTVVSGLVRVFTIKIHRLPSIHAVRIYKMLVCHLEQHYNRPKLFEDCNQIRYKIFECSLKMRADSLYHLGCPDSSGKLQFSPYLCVTYRNTDRAGSGPLGSPPPASPAIVQHTPCTVTYLALRRVFKAFITCLKQEKDWEILHLILQELPHVLQNKSLVLSKQANHELDLLVNALYSMITDKSLALPDSLRNTTKPNRSEFHASILSVMTNLASYHTYLDPNHQQKLIRCLVKYGLVSRCSKQCITALTICTLEMREVMVKMLPEVLLDLSKISATFHIAIPVLEFLSTLTKLPAVFASFVGDQYMAVFAISLPFTNPFKYNHYIVSLAHHVIAVWFLKCRLPFRRDFISYITKGLQTNVLVPFEETPFLKIDLSKLNQDSSDRKRSSSLTEQSSRRRERSTMVGRVDAKPSLELRPNIDRTLSTFYEELTETCIDLMARYTFSSCSALPRRLPTAEFLLSGGQAMTWLLGNKLITVTTSGCSQKPLKYGLCDKCWTLCKLENFKLMSSETESRSYKTARSGSSDKDREESSSSRVTRQNSGEKSTTSASSPVDEHKEFGDKLEQLPSKLQQLVTISGARGGDKHGCACWCQGWAEIYVRRPTGDMSWVMRIQNQSTNQQTMYDFPLDEISTVFMPSLHGDEGDTSEHGLSHEEPSNAEEKSSATSMPVSIPDSPTKQSPSRQGSHDSIEEDLESIYEDGSKSRNPVRRSNSSPEMSASWKNPFMLQKQDERGNEEDTGKKSKPFTKDMRVSCEAIPEEIAGTTPPSTDLGVQHPQLLSCHSYPGSAAPQEPPSIKSSQTVPASPSLMQPPTPRLLKSTKSESNDSVFSDKQTLTALANFPPISGKPPQSPTQTSPRLPRHAVKEKDGHEIQKSSSLVLEKTTSSSLTGAKQKERKNGSNERINEPTSAFQRRDRSYTISGVSTIAKPRLENLRRTNSPRPKEASRSGISPSFIFLQLYHMSHFGSPTERPLLVSSSQVVQRAMKVLDCIPPYETHKIGVIYVREGQGSNETDILRNRFGSVRYVQFLQNLGTLIKLQDVDSQVMFLGGLEQDGNDGKFTYIWQDDVIRVVFHVATLMPNKEQDPNCNNKKLHIGNDNVTIVYNESGEDYNINTIRGQFNFACVIIEPLDYNTNRVTVKVKDDLAELVGTSEPKIVSDQNVAILSRQLALHADLASLVSRSLKNQSQDPYASNWLERLRKIKNIRSKILQESKKEYPTSQEEPANRPRRGQMEDFTEYT